MPYKTGFPPLPYLDPKFVPNHPANNPPQIPDDKYLPMGKRERARLERFALEKALEEWTPPHVLRLWETDAHRTEQRTHILSLWLSPKLPEYDDLRPNNPYDSSTSRRGPTIVDSSDFRNFVHKRLHLGFHRIHAFGTDPDDRVPSGLPVDLPPEEVCWILEYTEPECNIVRRKLAFTLGEFPAVLDEDSPLYDPEIVWRYERRLYSRCRRREKRCIRPSHIEIFTSTGESLP